MRSLLVIPAVLLSLAAVRSADPSPANQLRDLAGQPNRFTGTRVTVELSITGEVRPAADGHPELDVTAAGVNLDRLKFRAVSSLADRVPDTGATHEEPLPARLVGRVLGPEPAGRGRYVIQVEEVHLLGPDGSVEDTLTPKAATPDPKPAPAGSKAGPPIEPPAPPKTETKPEPIAAPAAVEAVPTQPEAGLPWLSIAAGAGVVLLGAVVGVLVAARRRKPVPSRLLMPGPSAVQAPPTSVGPLSVSDRLSRRAR